MRKISIAVMTMLCSLPLFAQKKPLTIESVKNWPDIRNETISSDGKVLMYKIYKGLPDDTLVVQSVDQRWSEKFAGVTLPVFTANSQWFICKKKDSLFIYDLKKYRLVSTLGDITSFKTPTAGSGEWLACLTISPDKKLVLRNLKNNNTITYDSVAQFQFSDNGKVLLLQRNRNDGGKTGQVVQWVDLKDTKVYTIMH